MSKATRASQQQLLTICRSCDNCRTHKVRCSKEGPKCARCQELNLDCHYPKRRPRTSKPKDAGLDPRYLGLINGILERLDRLEVASSSSNGSPARSFESQTNGSLRQTSSPNSDISGLDVDAEMSDDGLEMTDASTFEMNTDNHDYFLEHNLHSMVRQATGLALESIDKPLSHFRVNESAKNTLLDLSVALAEMDGGNVTQISIGPNEEDMHFPTSLTNEWINYTSTYLRSEFFFDLFDWDLVSTIPNLIHSPFISLDSSILVIYYVVLYGGWIGTGRAPNETAIAEKLYARCLTLWKKYEPKEETQIVRLIGACWMTWMATDNLDLNQAWNFHAEACRVAQELGYHQLDDAAQPISHLDDKIEVKRKGFWQLVHTTYLFRLTFGKPILIEKFKVNLPSLITASGDSADNSLADITFVVTSRIAFIVTEFFAIVDMSPGHDISILDGKVEILCDEIESILVEWKIETFLESHANDPTATWMLGDLIIHACAAIILIQAQWYQKRAQHLTVERSIRAARKLIKSFNVIAASNTIMGSMSLAFVGPHSIVALLALYCSLIGDCDADLTPHGKESCAADMKMLHEMCVASRRLSEIKGTLEGPRVASNNLLDALWKVIGVDLEDGA